MKKAFTLLEVVIACAVLSLLSAVGYRLFTSFSRSFNKGSWSLNAQNSLRNALTYVREEMQKASYKTEIGINSAKIDKENYKFRIANSGVYGDAPDDNDKIKITGGIIASWYICLPASSNPPEFKCELSLNNGKLIYNKIQISGSSSEESITEREVRRHELADNIDCVLLYLSPVSPGLEEARLLKIKLKMSHPDKKNFMNTWVVSETAAKIEVMAEWGI